MLGIMSGYKIIINASNIKYGGGLQVAVSVISSLINNSRSMDFCFVVSQCVFDELAASGVPVRNITNVYIVTFEPFNVALMLSSLFKFKTIEKSFEPDLIFTIFGPGYYHSNSAINLVGFANAWLVQPGSKAYSIYSLKNRLLNKFKNYVLARLLYKNDCFYITESNAIAADFCEYFGAPSTQISVISNCLSHYFTKEYCLNPFDYLLEDDRFKFVTITHNYPHKNLKVIPLIGKVLHSYGFKFVFVVTLSQSEYNAMSDDFKKYTINVGSVSIVDCPKLYDRCDALFLPTLIECFSVSYLEAMYKRLPIATSDLAFAREVCPSGTYYFDPYDYLSISSSLMKLITENSSKNKCNAIEVFDQEVVSLYGSNETRVDKYVNLMRSLLRG